MTVSPDGRRFYVTDARDRIQVAELDQRRILQWEDPMTDRFADKPDFSPYSAVKNNIPLDQLNPPLGSLSGDQLYWAKKSLEQDLDDVDRIDEDVFNRIIWHAVKGHDRPYPVPAKLNF